MQNKIILKDINETRAWAREFAKTLRAPAAVALHGELGMGKSEIARAIIQELSGADTVVPSPTFTLVQSYKAYGIGHKAETTISHFDLYRIETQSELEEIGLPHAVLHDITLIEWPEIASHTLPKGTIHIYLEEEGGGRKLSLGQQ